MFKRNLMHRLFVAGLLLIGAATTAFSLVMTSDGGHWPADWPAELDELRPRATSIEYAGGNQEDIYYIPLDNRELFERLWPAFLSVKTPEAPIRFSPIDNATTLGLISCKVPAVVIYTPPKQGKYSVDRNPEVTRIENEMATASPERKKELSQAYSDALRHSLDGVPFLQPGPPWPDHLISDSGALPEYVGVERIPGGLRWIPVRLDERAMGFKIRARVEIELIVDGKVVDLNRIQFPPDTPIIDKRFDPRPAARE